MSGRETGTAEVIADGLAVLLYRQLAKHATMWSQLSVESYQRARKVKLKPSRISPSVLFPWINSL
jgi:hypothetical protein